MDHSGRGAMHLVAGPSRGAWLIYAIALHPKLQADNGPIPSPSSPYGIIDTAGAMAASTVARPDPHDLTGVAVRPSPSIAW